MAIPILYRGGACREPEEGDGTAPNRRNDLPVL